MHGLCMTPVTLVIGPQLHTHPEELPGITPTLQAGHEALAWCAMDFLEFVRFPGLLPQE